jgi:hypothetical protein
MQVQVCANQDVQLLFYDGMFGSPGPQLHSLVEYQ